MTNELEKQIIFGVDVSKCPYAEPAYGSPKCRINGYVHCDGFRNCEYKQLKRKKQRIVELNKTIKAKEQECEKLRFPMKDTNYAILTKEEFESFNQLKAELDRANCQIADDEILQCDMREAIEELKAENDELKARLRPLEDSYFNGLSVFHITELAKKSIRITAENRKLEQTLTEIKEIAEKLKNFYEELGKCEDLTVVRLKQILQKISEVEDV